MMIDVNAFLLLLLPLLANTAIASTGADAALLPLLSLLSALMLR